MTQIVEQRVRPTLIRRRAKKEEAPPEAPVQTEEKIESAAPAEEPVTKAVPAAPPAQAQVTSAPKEEPVTKVVQEAPRTVAPEAVRPKAEAKSAGPRVIRVSDRESIGKGLRIVQQAPTEAERAKTAVSATTLAARPTAVKEAEDKFKKAPRKKLSKAEMELEEIKRAGGLKHYMAEELAPVPEIEEPAVQQRSRVFEPGPRRKKQIKREFLKTQITQPKASKKVIKITNEITVSELSQSLGIRAPEIIKKLMALDIMATVNQAVGVDVASVIAKEYGFEVEHVAFKEEAVFEVARKKKSGQAVSRPPVVTVMGHVDHGKTSVLDYIRKTKVAAGEAGGITQHIGAYEVATAKGRITFIDTPGHAAFTAMRARGAKITDIVILVVAADDGVMPQTKEAIDHSRAAGVPMIVAINKIDKPEANLERTKRSLSEYGIIPEEWGGDVICVGTSAKSGEGIDQLLEMVLLQAEVMELKSDKDALARGAIIEAKLDRGLGAVATVLVQEGTLKVGSYVVCGLYSGKVRSLINSRGEAVESAGPSDAVSMIGLAGVPLAGDEIIEVEDEKAARMISETRQQKQREANLARPVRITLEDLQKQVADGNVKELGIVLKADVHGSVEAIKEALPRLSTEKVKVNIIHAGVGAVTESDVMLAAASNAVIVGFNVVPESNVSAIAEHEGIEIRRYSIIYDLMDDVRKSMEGLLAPLQVEKIIGHAQVRQVFTISKVGTIAGSMVVDGKIQRNAGARLVRDSVVVWTGKLDSLKRFKDDAREVAEGNECGIGLQNYNDIKTGDVIEAFIIEQVAQKL
jgi:translation initiation factor IF-2